MSGTLRAVVVALLVACCTPPSCVATSPGQSAVARGERYESGEPLYDEFFTQVFDAQVVMAKALDEEAAIRRGLAEEIDEGTPAGSAGAGGAATEGATGGHAGDPLASDETAVTPKGADAPPSPDDATSPETLSQKVGEMARAMGPRVKVRVKIDGELGDEGASVEVELIGEATDTDRRFADLVRGAIEDELLVLVHMRAQSQQLERLEAMSQGLEKNASSVFRRAGLAKSAEVKKNIRDSQAVIPLMKGRAQEVSTLAERTIRLLRAKATTAEPEEAPKPDKEEPEETKATPKPIPRRPSAPRPPPKPRPASSPSDFEP